MNADDVVKKYGLEVPGTDPADAVVAKYGLSKPTRGVFRTGADVGLSLAEGVVTGGRMVAEAAGADNTVSRGLERVAKGLGGMRSAVSQAHDYEAARAAQEAAGKGFKAETAASIKSFAKRPGHYLAQAVGTSVPTLAAIALTRGRVNPLVAGGGVGAVMGAGETKGSIYESVYQEALDSGKTEAEAKAIATKAQSYTGKNLDNILAGTGIGALAGTTGIERAFGGALARKAAPGAIKNMLRKGATEAVTEYIQEGHQGLAGNIAAQREGYHVPTMEGVYGQAAHGALAGFAAGGLFGAGESLVAQPPATRDPTVDVIGDEAAGAQQQDAEQKLLGNAGFIATPNQYESNAEEVQAAEERANRIYAERDAFEAQKAQGHGIDVEFAEEINIGPLGKAASLAKASGSFKQLGEFAEFLEQEKADIEKRRDTASAEQAARQNAEATLRMESDLETADARVADADIAKRNRQKLADIDAAMRSDNPMARFAELRSDRGESVLPIDVAIIKRRMAQQEVFKKDLPPVKEKSLPDEGMSNLVKERTLSEQTKHKDKGFAHIDLALRNGFVRKGNSLAHPKTGKKVNLNADEKAYINQQKGATDALQGQRQEAAEAVTTPATPLQESAPRPVAKPADVPSAQTATAPAKAEASNVVSHEQMRQDIQDSIDRMTEKVLKGDARYLEGIDNQTRIAEFMDDGLSYDKAYFEVHGMLPMERIRGFLSDIGGGIAGGQTIDRNGKQLSSVKKGYEPKTYLGKRLKALIDSQIANASSGQPAAQAKAEASPQGAKDETPPTTTQRPLGVVRDTNAVERALAAKAAPVLDLSKNPTGWKSVDFDNGRLLVSFDGKKSIVFKSANERSGTELARAVAKAHAFAIDNPYTTQASEGELVATPLFKEKANETPAALPESSQSRSDKQAGGEGAVERPAGKRGRERSAAKPAVRAPEAGAVVDAKGQDGEGVKETKSTAKPERDQLAEFGPKDVETAEERERRQSLNLEFAALLEPASNMASQKFPKPHYSGMGMPSDPKYMFRRGQTLVNVVRSGVPEYLKTRFLANASHYIIGKDGEDYIAVQLGVMKTGPWRKNLVATIADRAVRNSLNKQDGVKETKSAAKSKELVTQEGKTEGKEVAEDVAKPVAETTQPVDAVTTREQAEAEIVKQAKAAWSEQTQGSYKPLKEYPAKIRVNGKTIFMALFKKGRGGTVLYGETLSKLMYGYSFTQYKITGDKLEKTGSRNLFAHTKEAIATQVSDFNDIFGEYAVDVQFGQPDDLGKAKPEETAPAQKAQGSEKQDGDSGSFEGDVREQLSRFESGDFKLPKNVSYNLAGTDAERQAAKQAAKAANETRTKAYVEAAKRFVEGDMSANKPGKRDEKLDLEFVEGAAPKPITRNIKKAKTLDDSITALHRIAADGDIRYYLNGVHIEGDTLVATDGHRAAAISGVDTKGLPEKSKKEEGLTILSRYFGKKKGGPGLDPSVRWIDGKFPDWKRVMPEKHGVMMQLDAEKTANYARGVSRTEGYTGKIAAIPVTIDGVTRTYNAQYIADAMDLFRAFGYNTAQVSYTDAAAVEGSIYLSSVDEKVRQVVMSFRGNSDTFSPVVAEMVGGKAKLSRQPSPPQTYRVLSPDGKYIGTRDLDGKQARELKDRGYTLTPWRLSRGGKSGITTDNAKRIAEAFVAAHKGSADIKVVANIEAIKDSDLYKQIAARGALNDVEGASYKGDIYLFPQNLESDIRAAEVLVHEGRHFALAAIKGEGLNNVMAGIYKSNPLVKNAADAKMKSLGLKDIAEATEEALADMDVKQLRDLKGWPLLVAHIKAKVREMAKSLDKAGFINAASWLNERVNTWTDADVARLLKDADTLVTKPRSESVSEGDARLSRANETKLHMVGNVKVIQNPTRDHARKLIEKSEGKKLRGLRDPKTGNLYVWDAYQLMHKDAATGVGFTESEFDRLRIDETDGHGNGLIFLNNADMPPRGYFAGEKLDAAKFSLASKDTITIDGKERSRLNSNGKPIAQTDEGVRNFYAWFGDSKVVDADGRPLVVYHGTRGDVSVFSPDKIKDRFPNSEGFYFTSRQMHASAYADSPANYAEDFNPASQFAIPVEDGANVMPAYVSIQNPKTLSVSAFGTLESRIDGDGGAQVRAAREAGHDGVVVKREAGDDWDGTLAIAFRPEQIKSATGNQGTFDPTNRDIRLSRKPEGVRLSSAKTIRPAWLGENGEVNDSVRIDPTLKAIAKGGLGMFESATDRLRRSGAPILIDLADKIDRYYDQAEARLGKINGKLRPVLKEIRKNEKANMADFEEYWRAHDNGREAEAKAILDRNQLVKKLVDVVQDVFDDTGSENQNVDTPFGKGMKVFDSRLVKKDGDIIGRIVERNGEKLVYQNGELVGTLTGTSIKLAEGFATGKGDGTKLDGVSVGGYRTIGKFKRGEFWPRAFRADVQAVLQNPSTNLALWNEIVDALIDGGYIQNRSEAIAFRNDHFSNESSNDFFAGIEMARGLKLPEQFYDYSYDAFLRYAHKWSTRISQAEQFGQVTQPGQKDAFENAMSHVLDYRTKNYIKAAADIVYTRRNNTLWTNIISHLNLLATGLQLGNWATATLNLIGGTTLNVQHFGLKNTITAFREMAKDWENISQKGTELGILNKDYLRILQDNEIHGQYDIHAVLNQKLSKFAAFTLKWGGYTGTEHIIRTTAMLAARTNLVGALRAWNKEPGGHDAKKYREHMERNRIDVDKLIKENGEGAETARYLRLMVNIPQGSYRIDQVPIYLDTVEGRFLFKYQKFATQVTRMFWQQILQPFVDSIKEGKSGRERAEAFIPVARFFSAAIIGGSGVLLARSALFGMNDPGDDLDDIAKAFENDDTAKAWAMIAGRAHANMIAAAGYGMFGNYIQMTLDVADQQRVKNPLTPPGVAPINAIVELLTRGFEQGGRVTMADMDQIAERTFALYRTARRGAATASNTMGIEGIGFAELEQARRDTLYIRKVARNFAEDYGIEAKRTMTGRIGRTERSPENLKIYEAIMLGDAERARLLIKDALDASDDKKMRLQSIRSAVQSRHPVQLGAAPASRIQVAQFRKWAHDNLPESKVQRIEELITRYDRTAKMAGL